MKILQSEDNEVVWTMTDLVLSKNLPLNSHLFNGVVQTNLNIQECIMGHFGRDQAIYQALVREDVITDDSDMLNELLASEDAYPIYCPWFDSDFVEPKHSLNWKDLVRKFIIDVPLMMYKVGMAKCWVLSCCWYCP